VILCDEQHADMQAFFRQNKVSALSLGSAKKPSTIAQRLYAVLHELDGLNAKQAFILYPHMEDANWRRAIYYRLDKMTEPARG
jgi:hypothetical protein